MGAVYLPFVSDPENPVSAPITAKSLYLSGHNREPSISHFWVPTSLPHPIHNQKLSVPPEDFREDLSDLSGQERFLTHRGMLEKIACMI